MNIIFSNSSDEVLEFKTTENSDSFNINEDLYKKYYLTTSKQNNLIRLGDDFHVLSFNNNHDIMKPALIPSIKDLTEVSYEFSSDLSKVNRENDNEMLKSKLNYSKSFTKSDNNENIPEQIAGFTNPFRRTNFSKSFTAFTSRLKQSRASNKSINKHSNNNKQPEFEINKKIESVATQSSTDFPYSSPELSSSSNFSSNSSISNVAKTDSTTAVHA